MVRKIKERSFSGRLSQAPEEYEKIHAAVSRKAASEGIVLLKNEEHLLPVKKGSRIALFGAGASRTVKGGTGSGDVNERESVSICQGLKDAGYEITTEEWISEYEALYMKKRLEWKAEILRKSEAAQRRSRLFYSIFDNAVLGPGRAGSVSFGCGAGGLCAQPRCRRGSGPEGGRGRLLPEQRGT